jgi:hypothetical protein
VIENLLETLISAFQKYTSLVIVPKVEDLLQSVNATLGRAYKESEAKGIDPISALGLLHEEFDRRPEQEVLGASSLDCTIFSLENPIPTGPRIVHCSDYR